MNNLHTERLKRARLSLEGLSVADALGGFFEFQKGDSLRSLTRTIPSPPWRYTDDTAMALSIYEILRLHQRIDQDELALSFGTHFERGRGYGMSQAFLLPRLGKGEDWRTTSKRVFPDGSFGNGGPMKIAPLGAYFADDFDLVLQQVELATVVTHAHAESVAGSKAVAVAAAIAWNTRAEATPDPKTFIQQVIDLTPQSEVRDGLDRALQTGEDTTLASVVETLGNGSRISSMDSVPFVIWCAAQHLRDYEEAIWTTIRAGGDVDTLAAMVGGIVACAVGSDRIPSKWRESREQLPEWALGES